MRWFIMGLVVGMALALAGWGHARWSKRHISLPRTRMAYWDGREAADAADELVRGLPRHGEGDAPTE